METTKKLSTVWHKQPSSKYAGIGFSRSGMGINRSRENDSGRTSKPTDCSFNGGNEPFPHENYLSFFPRPAKEPPFMVIPLTTVPPITSTAFGVLSP